MARGVIKAPFFEIGPKSYLYGDEVLELALAADKASEKYGVDIIFTCPVVDIRRVVEATKHIHVFAPHMDPIPVGRGTADTLAEALTKEYEVEFARAKEDVDKFLEQLRPVGALVE